jgi:hypothetical protein
VDQDVNLPKGFAGLCGDGGDILVFRDIARLDEGASDRSCQRSHAALQRFSGVADADPGALDVHGLGDAPGNRAFVGKAKYQSGFTF